MTETAEPWLPYWARCEAMRSWPDDNVSACGQLANRRVIDHDGHERYVCAGHGHDLPDLEQFGSSARGPGAGS